MKNFDKIEQLQKENEEILLSIKPKKYNEISGFYIDKIQSKLNQYYKNVKQINILLDDIGGEYEPSLMETIL